jgi:DNA end-binding protein Ku
MARAIWKGHIAFGLVEIPVGVVPAVSQQERVAFHLLDRRDHAPVGYERVNKRTGARVPWEEIVRGYEHAQGEHVLVSDAELERANPEKTQTIDIQDFVDGSEIESVYWDTPYYLEPLHKKSRSYVLLRDVLTKTGKVAIAQVVLRNRQHLAAVTVKDGVLVLVLLRYAHTIKPASTIETPSLAGKGVSEKELAMAERLVESMTGPWKPEAYEDTYHADVLALVRKKVRAGKTEAIETPEKGERPRARREVLDLMPLLERSMGRARAVSAEPRRSKPATRRKRA